MEKYIKQYNGVLCENIFKKPGHYYFSPCVLSKMADDAPNGVTCGTSEKRRHFCNVIQRCLILLKNYGTEKKP